MTRAIDSIPQDRLQLIQVCLVVVPWRREPGRIVEHRTVEHTVVVVLRLPALEREEQQRAKHVVVSAAVVVVVVAVVASVRAVVERRLGLVVAVRWR